MCSLSLLLEQVQKKLVIFQLLKHVCFIFDEQESRVLWYLTPWKSNWPGSKLAQQLASPSGPGPSCRSNGLLPGREGGGREEGLSSLHGEEGSPGLSWSRVLLRNLQKIGDAGSCPVLALKIASCSRGFYTRMLAADTLHDEFMCDAACYWRAR